VRSASGLVRGELYQLDQPHLTELDVFEGCPELYRRELVRAESGRWVFAYFASDRISRRLRMLPGEFWTE
jgi:gamma-glutamylaminecyclotransferase